MKKGNTKRWRVVAIFFSFMLLHQTDKLLIGPLKGPISDEFGITDLGNGAL